MTRTRREFLKSIVGTASFLSLAPTVPGFLCRAAVAADQQPATRDTVLVVLQLSGGNDGLNTVVPFADDVYARSRDTLRLTESQVIKIDSYQGFHPELKEFQRLMQEGALTVVQGVGYPNSNRDHDVAMREWHTARPADPQCPTGWVGRAVDQVAARSGPCVPAAFVGPIAQPFALNAAASVIPSLQKAEQLTIRAGLSSLDESAAVRQWLAGGVGGNPGQGTPTRSKLADLIASAATNADRMSRQVENVLAAAKSPGEYPSYTLANQLQVVSQLIRADLGVRIYFLEIGGGGIGGFDNHANQRDNHAALLREMSASIGAFVNDMRRANLLSRVALMTFSEFGRTVSENGRRGTDHGAAAPVMVAGGQLRGGLLGPHPSLADLDQDALKFQVDYRSLLATVLQSWLGFDPEPILGAGHQPIELFA
jgi:uncharacterized protein (DUF1501 family)